MIKKMLATLWLTEWLRDYRVLPSPVTVTHTQTRALSVHCGQFQCRTAMINNLCQMCSLFYKMCAIKRVWRVAFFCGIFAVCIIAPEPMHAGSFFQHLIFVYAKEFCIVPWQWHRQRNSHVVYTLSQLQLWSISSQLLLLLFRLWISSFAEFNWFVCARHVFGEQEASN